MSGDTVFFREPRLTPRPSVYAHARRRGPIEPDAANRDPIAPDSDVDGRVRECANTGCGRSLVGRAPSAHYCSQRCRQAAYRARTELRGPSSVDPFVLWGAAASALATHGATPEALRLWQLTRDTHPDVQPPATALALAVALGIVPDPDS